MTDSDDIDKDTDPSTLFNLCIQYKNEIERLRSDRERIRNIADGAYNRISAYVGYNETEDNEAAYWGALGEILEILDR